MTRRERLHKHLRIRVIGPFEEWLVFSKVPKPAQEFVLGFNENVVYRLLCATLGHDGWARPGVTMRNACLWCDAWLVDSKRPEVPLYKRLRWR